MDNNRWVEETLSLRVLRAVRRSVPSGIARQAQEHADSQVQTDRIEGGDLLRSSARRRAAASVGAFATALAAVMGGAVGTAAAAPAPTTTKGHSSGSTSGATTASGSGDSTAGAKAAAPKSKAASSPTTSTSSSQSGASTTSPATGGSGTTAAAPSASGSTSPSSTNAQTNSSDASGSSLSSGGSGQAATANVTAGPAASSSAKTAPAKTSPAKTTKGGASPTATSSSSGGTVCDSSGSGEATFTVPSGSPPPSFNENTYDAAAPLVNAGQVLKVTYFDEAGFHTTGSVTGPWSTSPAAQAASGPYSDTQKVLAGFSVSPATQAGTKAGVPISATVPSVLSHGTGFYAVTISVADDDDKVPAPCTVQWLLNVGPPPPPATPTSPPPPVVPPGTPAPPPQVQLTKLNNAAGTGFGSIETAASGSTSVPYRVTVTNPNPSPGTITVLTDTVDGTTSPICPGLINTVLAASGQPGDSTVCDFTGPVPKTPTVDTAGVTLSVNGVLVSATSQSTVLPPPLGTVISPASPATPAPAAAPATLAFTGAPLGRMLAGALGLIALGLLFLAGLQLADESRRPLLQFLVADSRKWAAPATGSASQVPPGTRSGGPGTPRRSLPSSLAWASNRLWQRPAGRLGTDEGPAEKRGERQGFPRRAGPRTNS